jgi:hypothetical protein
VAAGGAPSRRVVAEESGAAPRHGREWAVLRRSLGPPSAPPAHGVVRARRDARGRGGVGGRSQPSCPGSGSPRAWRRAKEEEEGQSRRCPVHNGKERERRGEKKNLELESEAHVHIWWAGSKA